MEPTTVQVSVTVASPLGSPEESTFTVEMEVRVPSDAVTSPGHAARFALSKVFDSLGPPR